MFKPSKLHHSICQNNASGTIPEYFGLLCWNVYKNNQKHPRFQDFLRKEVEKREIDFLLFQEAAFHDAHTFELPCFSYDAAANLELKGSFFGVLTASRIDSRNARAYLSEAKESLLGPHKSLLLSEFAFKNGEPLLIFNIHAINFRENSRYIKELERFFTLVEGYEGAMVIAGDFNSWNNRRMAKLQQFAQRLSLSTALFKEEKKIKSFMGKHLDFVFYRGLKLEEACVLEGQRFSDHNPLYVRFRKQGREEAI